MTFNPDMSTFHYPDGQTKLELELAPPELGASLIAPVFLGSPVAQLVKNCLQCRRPGFDPWVEQIPWRRERLPTPVFWSGELHGRCSPWGRKELDTSERLSLSFS